MLAAGAALTLTAANPASLQVPPTRLHRMGHSTLGSAGDLDFLAVWRGDLRHRQLIRHSSDPCPGRRLGRAPPSGAAGRARSRNQAGLSFLAGELVLLTYYCPGLWRIATLAWRCSRRTRRGTSTCGMRAVSYAAAAELVLILLRSATIIERSSGIPVAGLNRGDRCGGGRGGHPGHRRCDHQCLVPRPGKAFPPGLALVRLLAAASAVGHPAARRATIELPRQSGTRFNVRYRLHRRVIEIRDAQLILRPYWRSDIPARLRPRRGRPADRTETQRRRRSSGNSNRGQCPSAGQPTSPRWHSRRAPQRAKQRPAR